MMHSPPEPENCPGPRPPQVNPQVHLALVVSAPAPVGVGDSYPTGYHDASVVITRVGSTYVLDGESVQDIEVEGPSGSFREVLDAAINLAQGNSPHIVRARPRFV